MAREYRPWEQIDSERADKLIGEWEGCGNPELSKSLGRIIISWSHLENTIQMFLRELIDLRADHFLATVGQLDIYQKIDAVYSITSLTSPDPRWNQHLLELRKFINGELREERNRIAHDLWLNESEISQSIRFKPTVDKKTSKPDYATVRDLSQEDLNILSAKIIACGPLVMNLRDVYFAGKREPWRRKQTEGSL